jgi:hypothetical protein
MIFNSVLGVDVFGKIMYLNQTVVKGKEVRNKLWIAHNNGMFLLLFL